jgi:hypothetical protein
MKFKNPGSSIATAVGVGTAIGVALHDTTVGFGVGVAIAFALNFFENSQNKEK